MIVIGQNIVLPHLCIIIILCSMPITFGSTGDRSQPFQRCLNDCQQMCSGKSYPAYLPLYLLVFGWSCKDECKYVCMHNVTEDALVRGQGVQQYYGKWPFVRLFGIQEPASVIFSFGNGLGHYLGWMMYKGQVHSDHPMYSTWKLSVMISINAWFWSIVFHTRDLIWTERLDYFGAVSLILASIYACFTRTVGVQHKWRCRVFGLFVVALFCCHCGYLSFVRFDYGYNMKANVTVGVINIVGWLFWCLKHWKERPYVWKCAFLNTAVFFLVALELWDFPPVWGIFDAHALWHCSTIPCCYFWYSFLVDDAKHDDAKYGKTP